MKNYDEITSKLLSRRDAFVESKKKRTKIVVSATLSCIVLISALSVGIVKGGVFKTTPNGESNVTSNNSETSSQNKKVIYVTGDTPDEFFSSGSSDLIDSVVVWGSDIPAKNGKYISPKLQEKLDFYKDNTDSEVVYRVVVKIRILQSEVTEIEELIDSNEELRLLLEQEEAASLEEQKARAEYKAFDDAHPEWASNPEKYPELTAECSRLAEIYEAKEKARKKLRSQWEQARLDFFYSSLNDIITKRLEYAAPFSEKEPVPTVNRATDYYPIICTGYYMDLTADEIYMLEEKGEYTFSLASDLEKDLNERVFIDC